MLGATIPGFLQVGWNGKGFAIRAGGALALFIATYLLAPSVVKEPEPDRLDHVLVVHAVNVEEHGRVLEGRLVAHVNQLDYPFPARSNSWVDLSNIRDERFVLDNSARYIVKFKLEIRRKGLMKEVPLEYANRTAYVFPSEYQFGRVCDYTLTSPQSSINATIKFEISETRPSAHGKSGDTDGMKTNRNNQGNGKNRGEIRKALEALM